MWVEDQNNIHAPNNAQCAADGRPNQLAAQQDNSGCSISKDTVAGGGMCMPLECTRRGLFQPSHIEFNTESPTLSSICTQGVKDCTYFKDDKDGLKKTAFMQHAMEQRGEVNCEIMNTTPPTQVSHSTCCVGIEEKDDKECGAYTNYQCKTQSKCQMGCRNPDEMCVWRKGSLQCVPARVPRCTWRGQATNPKHHICSAIGSHAKTTAAPGQTRAPHNYQSSIWYMKSSTISKGMCVEDHGSTLKPTHLDGSTATPPPPDDIYQAHLRSSNYENDCTCHFAPLGYCESIQEERDACPAPECMRVQQDGNSYCTSRAFAFCQNACQQLHPSREMICPYSNPDGGGSNPADWLKDHTATPQEIQHCSNLSRDPNTCHPPCMWDATDNKCKPVPKKLSAETYTCSVEQPSPNCLAHHTISEYQQTSCNSLAQEDCKAAAGCTWGYNNNLGVSTCTGTAAPTFTRLPLSCTQNEAKTAVKRNTCLEMCMRTPDNYCQGVCHTTGCIGSCYRHHMGSMQQWKGMPQCNSTLHLQRNPEYHQWKAECSQTMQGECVNVNNNTYCQKIGENECGADTKCLWTQNQCVAQPVITSASAAVAPTNQPALIAAMKEQGNISPSSSLLQQPDVTCSDKDHAWSRPVLYSSPAPDSPNEYYCTPVTVGTTQCTQYSTDQNGNTPTKSTCLQHGPGCYWDASASLGQQCKARTKEDMCSAKLQSCNPGLCASSSVNHNPYCPCKNGEKCISWGATTCRPKQLELQSIGTAKTPDTAPVQNCVTHKCAAKYMKHCHTACHVKSRQKETDRRINANTPPISCPDNMPWMYGRQGLGGLYCCSSYMGPSDNHTKTYSSLDACIHGGATGSYNVPPLDQATASSSAPPAKSFHFIPRSCRRGAAPRRASAGRIRARTSAQLRR